MATNLSKDAVFSITIPELDPAASIQPSDLLILSQNGATKKASLAQLQSEYLTDDELNAHIAGVNPHGVTAAQLGAYTTQQATTAIATATSGVQSNLDSHAALTNNPHNVTAAQVGRDIAQWNANKVQGRSVASLASADDGSVLMLVGGSVIAKPLYPVGSIYINAESPANPSTFLGFGTWVTFGAGRCLVSLDPSDADFDTPGELRGSKLHTLTAEQMPFHGHGVNDPGHSHSYARFRTSVDANQLQVAQGNNDGFYDYPQSEGKFTGISIQGSGGSQPHNNIQPSIVVYMWKRTA